MTPLFRRGLLASALLTACADPAPPLPAAPPPAYAPPPAPPAPVDPRAQIQLPFSTTRAPVPTGLPVILVTRQAIVLQGDDASLIPLPPNPALHGADAAYKRSGDNDLLLVPLAAALARSPLRGAGAVAVGADASVPYRVLIEALFTAGQSQISSFHLLTRTAAGFGSIETHPPKLGGMRGPDLPSLNLSLIIVQSGVSVKSSGGNIAPGCAAIGPGLTFPRGPAGLDLAGLKDCATSLRQRDPRFAAEHNVTLAANADVPFGEIVSVMDALRTEPSGAPGFPDVAFGIFR